MDLRTSLFIISTILIPPQYCESALMKGKTLDSSKAPMQDVEIYAYSTADVRRAADFISAKTGRDGVYSLTLPEGVFWVIARERKNGDQIFGPLPVDRKHSGEPVMIESGSSVIEQDFELYSLKESAERKRFEKSDLKTVKGFIQDGEGKPKEGAYIIAVRKSSTGGYEKFFSPFTKVDGLFEIKLPDGEYTISAEMNFPNEVSRQTIELNTSNPTEVILKIE